MLLNEAGYKATYVPIFNIKKENIDLCIHM